MARIRIDHARGRGLADENVFRSRNYGANGWKVKYFGCKGDPSRFIRQVNHSSRPFDTRGPRPEMPENHTKRGSRSAPEYCSRPPGALPGILQSRRPERRMSA